MPPSLRSIAADALDLLLPSYCVCCCRRARIEICDQCLSAIELIDAPSCARCGKPTVGPVEGCPDCKGWRGRLDQARSAWVYLGAAKELVLALKFQNAARLARPMAEAMARVSPGRPGETVTWVPIDRPRLARRGYNQAERLARHYAEVSGLPAVGTLGAVRTTKSQTDLDPAARRQNVRGAFSVNSRRLLPGLPGSRMVLVDDVLTTGATALECAETLLGAGAESVRLVTACRAGGAILY